MYIAIDIGGTTIRIAATDTLDTPHVASVKKIPASNNYSEDLRNIISQIHEITEGEEIQAVGCGVPATFSEDKKTILVAPNLSDWNNKNFFEDLEKAFACPVHMENDDTIAALGEATYGYGKEKDFVYITWGTGLGGAKVKQKNGRVTIKQFEAGHQILVWQDGRLCGCGQTGCAEAYVGGGNIEKYYGKKVSELTGNEWNDILDHLAQALINVIAFYPTQLFIIGGGVAIHHTDKEEQIAKKIQERLRIYPSPQVHITTLGDDLGLMGSFALLR